MTFVPQDWSNCFLRDGTSWCGRRGEMYPPKLYSGPTIQSRSAARRAAQDLVMQMVIFIAKLQNTVLKKQAACVIRQVHVFSMNMSAL